MDKKAQWSLVAAAWTLVTVVVVLGLFALKVLGQRPPAAQPGPQSMATPEAFDLAGLPARATCPVTHEELHPTTATPRVNYMGHSYFFSTQRDSLGVDAKTLFLRDPQLYLTGVSGMTQPAPQASAQPSPAASPQPSPRPTAAPSAAPSPQLRPSFTATVTPMSGSHFRDF